MSLSKKWQCQWHTVWHLAASCSCAHRGQRGGCGVQRATPGPNMPGNKKKGKKSRSKPKPKPKRAPAPSPEPECPAGAGYYAKILSERALAGSLQVRAHTGAKAYKGKGIFAGVALDAAASVLSDEPLALLQANHPALPLSALPLALCAHCTSLSCPPFPALFHLVSGPVRVPTRGGGRFAAHRQQR